MQKLLGSLGVEKKTYNKYYEGAFYTTNKSEQEISVERTPAGQALAAAGTSATKANRRWGAGGIYSYTCLSQLFQYVFFTFFF